jgi:hypothetical protein
MAHPAVAFAFFSLDNGFMPDFIYLSLTVRGYNESNMLQLWQRVMELFPASESFPGIKSVAIYPFNWSETPVFERSFGEPAGPDDAVSLASEFLHDDYAYEVEMVWDLWVPAPLVVENRLADSPADSEEPADTQRNEATGWIQVPSSVSISCLGSGFERDGSEDRTSILVKFGLDTPFLPAEEDVLSESEQDPEEADLRTRQNLQLLIQFVHDVDEALPLENRLLWCESGENLAEKILDAWDERI